MYDTSLKKKVTSNTPILDNTTYSELYGNKPYANICMEENCIIFQNVFKEIFRAGTSKGLQNGEVLQLIKKATNGRFLEDIPYIELSSIKKYVEKNAEEALLTINPTLYGTLKFIGYYNKDKFKRATAEEVREFTSRLMHLFSTKAPYSAFFDLAKKTIQEV